MNFKRIQKYVFIVKISIYIDAHLSKKDLYALGILKNAVIQCFGTRRIG